MTTAGRNRLAQAQPDEQARIKRRRDVDQGLQDGLMDPTHLPGMQAQTALLDRESLHSVQRQALAAQIGRVHGNQHLQRVVASPIIWNQGRAQTHVIQRTVIEDVVGAMGLTDPDARGVRLEEIFAHIERHVASSEEALDLLCTLYTPDDPLAQRFRAEVPGECHDYLLEVLEDSLSALEQEEAQRRARALQPTQSENPISDIEGFGISVTRGRRLAHARWANRPRTQAALERGELPPTPPARLGNPNAVDVNLWDTGVEVRQKTGSAQTSVRIDPLFALAMINFLQEIGPLGVEIMYNQGFARAPMSLVDTHAQGLACDICGFGIDGQRLELSFEDDESAWFNTTDRVQFNGAEQTYRDVMVNLARRMTNHFGQIIGPGYNAMHMNHFHVQLRGTRRTHGLHTPAAPGELAERRPYL